jgi:protocatechuate 3,4-dioxygenase beta subunit
MRAGLLAVLGALALAVSGATVRAATSACPNTNPPNELVLAGGSGETAQLGKPFGQPFSVALANKNGCPLTGNLAGTLIRFDAPGSGASGFFASSGSNAATAGTDAQGVAVAPAFTANDTAGSYTVEASSDYGTIDIPATNTAAGLAAGVSTVVSGVQRAPVGTPFATPLQARVVDANGNPIQGAAVSFTIVPGATGAAGTFLAASQAVLTDSNGVATAPPLLANGVAGAFMVTASTDGLPAIAAFTLENLETYNSMTTAAGTRAARVGGRYAPVAVHVVDTAGKPVQGVAVQFSVDGAQGGPGATFVGGSAMASAMTDANGLAASPPLTAGKVSGSFSVVAATSTVRAPLAIRFRALPGRAAEIAAGAASGESAIVGARFPVRLAVTVTDADGNAVAGVRVTFTAPAHGPSAHVVGSHARRVGVKTDAGGVAVAPPLVANRRAGGYAVTATAAGKSTAFALVNVAKS